MTWPTRRRRKELVFWLAVGLNVIGVGLSLASHEYGKAGLQGALVAGMVFLFHRVDVWSAACIREAEAKAQFAELMLEKLRRAEGFSVEMAAPVSAGTKH